MALDTLMKCTFGKGANGLNQRSGPQGLTTLSPGGLFAGADLVQEEVGSSPGFPGLSGEMGLICGRRQSLGFVVGNGRADLLELCS